MIEVFRPVSLRSTRHPGHFSGQRKVSVLMRTTWGGPGSAAAGWCFPGLNQKASKAGRALADFALPSARCQPSQPRHCRRVVRIGANTLHGGSAACPKRRVRRRTVTRPPRAKLPVPRAARIKERTALNKMLRLVHPHRKRHPEHFSEQRKVPVLMRTAWGGPGSASAGWCFPDLNQKASQAGRCSGRFCPACRPVPAAPAAALPPRSAPRSEHAAQCECSVSETPRAAADGDAATPRKTSHPRAARRKERAALIQMLCLALFNARRKNATQTKTSPGQGRAHPEMFHVEHFAGPQFCKNNVPRGTF